MFDLNPMQMQKTDHSSLRILIDVSQFTKIDSKTMFVLCHKFNTKKSPGFRAFGYRERRESRSQWNALIL